MELSYVDKCILVAEKDYRTTNDKLNYVNQMLKRIVIEEGKTEVIIKRNPKSSQKPLSRTNYYRRLEQLRIRAKERAHLISKNYLFELVNEHDTLLSDRKELREIIDQAKGLDKLQSVIIAKREHVDIGRRILSIKETIKSYIEEPDLEDEEQIERQIQLLTSS